MNKCINGSTDIATGKMVRQRNKISLTTSSISK